jgi:hypothetical protein
MLAHSARLDVLTRESRPEAAAILVRRDLTASGEPF